MDGIVNDTIGGLFAMRLHSFRCAACGQIMQRPAAQYHLVSRNRLAGLRKTQMILEGRNEPRNSALCRFDEGSSVRIMPNAGWR